MDREYDDTPDYTAEAESIIKGSQDIGDELDSLERQFGGLEF
jgi:hypothetical protein